MNYSISTRNVEARFASIWRNRLRCFITQNHNINFRPGDAKASLQLEKLEIFVETFIKSGIHTIFQNTIDHFKILGARSVIWKDFHMDGPKILGTAVQDLGVHATWRPGFVYPCISLLKEVKEPVLGYRTEVECKAFQTCDEDVECVLVRRIVQSCQESLIIVIHT